MKTSIFFALGLIIVAFSSCKKKEYLCECQGGFTGGGNTFMIKKSFKGNAKAECYDHNSDHNTNDGYHHCELK